MTDKKREERLRSEGVIGGRYDNSEVVAALLDEGDCDVMDCGSERMKGLRVCERHARGMAAAANGK